MTDQEFLLVAGMAGLAVAITLADLLVSWLRHRRAAWQARESQRAAALKLAENGAAAARREAIRRRLAAIQSAGPEPSASSHEPDRDAR